jgi:hypothetical protein
MGATAITQADFKLFLALWNQLQNQSTPDLHFCIASWLEESWRRQDPELLLMVFRSAGKSTLAGLFAAWLLYRKADLRLLVLAADSTLAGKMVRNVKRIIERHPLCKNMKPKNADQWASDRFTVRRPMELRDPSMLARGISSNLTGSRADVIICDDVEVPNTCDTAEKREQLREWLAEISYVLVPGGTQLYIGTPHNYYSIYAHDPRTEVGEQTPFLNGFKRLEIPVLCPRGESAWPERFSPMALKHMKRQTGPNKFNSQMMLRPVNVAEGRLDPKLLRFYDGELDYTPELNTLFLNGKKLISASAFWDPAFGSAKGDHSVLAVIYTDEEGLNYLQHIEYISIQPSLPGLSGQSMDAPNKSGHDVNGATDEATQQCRIVAQIAKEMRLPSIAVETNGIGKFLPGLLRNELSNAKAPTTVKEITSTRNKDLRILEAFDAFMAARRLYVHKRVQQTPFVTEMQEWRPGSNKGHDDGLDAVAGALAQEPIRLQRIYGKGSHSWTGRNNQHTAKTDFKV